MKPKTLILMVVAVTCGLGASYMTSRLLAERTETPQEKVSILVARKSLDQGLVIKNIDDVFAIKDVPLEMAEKDTLRAEDAEHYKGRLLKRARRQGDVVRQDDFLDEKEYSIEYLMSQGYRAIGIRVNSESIAAGFAARPLSRVDIIATVKGAGKEGSFAMVLLENVLVLASDGRMTRDESGQAMPANVVTVALKQEDALKVSLAREHGPLSLMLRKFDDSSKSVDLPKFTIEQLYTNATDRKQTEEIEPPTKEPKLKPIKPVDVAKVEPKVQSNAIEHPIVIRHGDREHKVTFLLHKETGEVITPSNWIAPEPQPPQVQPPIGPARPEPQQPKED